MRHSSVLPLAGVIALAMAGSALAQEGGRISVGASLEGELTGRDPTTDDGSHYDGYRFQARAGERVAISLESDSFDPVLIVGRQNRRSFEELARNDDAVRRFIALVDECYDRRVPLYIEAEVALDELYTQGYLAFAFRRTLSRLHEMQLQRFGVN